MPLSDEWSATIQAGSAVLTVIATLVLVGLNLRYIRQNQDLLKDSAESTKASRRLAEIETKRETARVAPYLAWETEWTEAKPAILGGQPTPYKLKVRNLGTGPALNCRVSWHPAFMEPKTGVPTGRIAAVPEPFAIGSGAEVFLILELEPEAHFASPASATLPDRIPVFDDRTGEFTERSVTRETEAYVGKIEVTCTDLYQTSTTFGARVLMNHYGNEGTVKRSLLRLDPLPPSPALIFDDFNADANDVPAPKYG